MEKLSQAWGSPGAIEARFGISEAGKARVLLHYGLVFLLGDERYLIFCEMWMS